jgi:hypothetical protein
MSINTYIIDHEIKLMEMGGREEILLERETISLIILPESVATSLINPSLKRATICRRRTRLHLHSENHCSLKAEKGQEIPRKPYDFPNKRKWGKA